MKVEGNNGVIAYARIFRVDIVALHRGHTWRRAELLVILLTLCFYVLHSSGIIALSCRNYISIDAINIIELPDTDFRGYAFIADEIMLGKAILIDADNRCRVKRIVTVLMESNPLRCAVDIDALHGSMALDDAFATGIVGIAARLAVIRKHHQPIVFVPIHLARLARRVIRYRQWIPARIVGIMVMPDLRGRRGVLAVLVQISKRIRLRHFARIHLLFLGKRFAHDAVGHIQLVRRRLGFTVCRNQPVDVVVDIAVAICPAELRLVLLGDILRIGSVDDTEDIIHQVQVVLVLVLHDGITRRDEHHLLQTFVLRVVSVIAFHPIAELSRNGMFIT